MQNILENKEMMNNFISFFKIYLEEYNYEDRVREKLKEFKIKILNQEQVIFLAFPFIYNNLKTILKYIKMSLDIIESNKKLEDFEYITLIIYLKKNGMKNEDIIKYIKYNYNKIIEEKEVNIYENLKVKLKENDENLYLKYMNFKSLINKNKIEKLDISFFEKREKLKWLPTNNRKTPTYFPDYGKEVENLIKYIYEDEVLEYNYRKVLLILNISNFEKTEIENLSLIEVRAILTSILRRERFGSGSIPYYIENGIVERLLKRYKNLLEDDINGS